MKKGIGAGVLCLAAAGLFLMALYYQDMQKEHWGQYKYQESVYPLENPDRGLYIQADIKDDYAYAPDFEPQLRLRLLTMNLYDFQEVSVLPETKTRQLRTALDAYRSLGITVIFRAGYYFGEPYCTEPSEFETILHHAKQICNILNEYPDVVQVVQAGFIGPYGEWHSSIYMERRMELLSCLLQELSEEIPVAVRRPMFVREAQEAGLETDRCAIHNDAFLSSDTDMGTYVEEGYDRSRELEWMQEHIQRVMNGGEMTNVSVYTRVENAIAEMKQMNMTYLNGYYNKEVLKEWQHAEYMGQNACAYIVSHLGYRLFLKEISFNTKITGMQQMQMEMTVANSGFAMPLETYQWFLIIRSGEQEKRYPLELSIQGEEISVFFRTDLWRDFPEMDRLELGLCITRDENRSKHYSIELANDALVFEQGINWFGFYEMKEHEIWPNTYQYVFGQIEEISEAKGGELEWNK